MGRVAVAKPVKARVLIVDDHPIVRRGLRELIDQEADLVVCGEAADAREALEAIQSLRPSIAIVDISLRGRSGLDLIKNLRAHYPSVPVLVVSMHDERLYAQRALRAGARGYITKQEATERMMIAIRQVLNGQIYTSENVTSEILTQLTVAKGDAFVSPIERLSDRELEVFELIGLGRGTREIAQGLRLSVKTVESHREHIKDKLSLNNATELIQHAVRWVEGHAKG